LKKFEKVYEASFNMKLKEDKKRIIIDDIKLIKHVKKAAVAGNMTLKNLNIDYLHADYKGKKVPSYSISLIVMESHIALYTYPELNAIHINISTCASEKSLRDIVGYFEKVFGDKINYEMRIIELG